MGQRVDYEVLLGARSEQYVMKVRAVLGYVCGPATGDFKPFRDFVRKQGLWDKERTGPALSFLGITWDRKKVVVSALARRLEATTSDDETRTELFELLKSENILLVKYVLEALDVESGGRLHSVHELYRMVTSYVYPGDYITLPCFQAWVEWMACTGYIKMVGIRWALSEKGLEAVSELKAMDIEEILEDMEEEEEASEAPVEDDWGVPESRTDSLSGAEPAPEVKGDTDPTAPEAEAAADADEEWFESPPEASPPTAEEVEAAEASFLEQFSDVGEVPVEETASPSVAEGSRSSLKVPILTAVRPLAATVVHGADAQALAETITGWWNVLGDWPVLTANELGVVPAAEGSGQNPLLEMATIAVCIEGLEPQPQVFAFIQMLRDTGYFRAIARAKSGPQVLGALDALADEPWMRGLRERLVHMSGIHQRLAGHPDLLDALEASASGREAVILLRDQVFGDAWAEAPFWTLRELCRMGILTNASLLTAAVVPSARLQRNALRIGLIPRASVASFSEMIAIAEATAALFGPDSGYGEALEVMDRAFALGA